jgi:transcriptional regulator of acetoin/glycerol metabolism
MLKRIYLKNGKRHYLPFGFHLIEDLIPFFKLKQDLLKNNLSKEAKLRLRWFDYWRKCQNVSLVCRYFGISRKTFYYWLKRYSFKS